MSKQSEYDRKSRQRKRDAGQVKVEVWVYKEDREALIAYARELREKRENKNG